MKIKHKIYLKLIILAVFFVVSTACFLLSGNSETQKNPDLRKIFSHHAKTLRDAVAQNVGGDFERENRFESAGVKVEMFKQDTRFFAAFEKDNSRQVFEIKSVIGTKSLQQYVAEIDEKQVRLPIAYDLQRKHWLNLNEAFFEPDGKDFFYHQKDREKNCASCHLEQTLSDETLTENFADETLSSDEILLACGKCHAKGLQNDFPPSEKIFNSANYSKDAIYNLQNLPQDESHFFENGAIRLSSHEFQGVLRSVCFVKTKSGGSRIEGEKINCLSCHSIKNGKISNEKILNFQACTNCHQQLSTPEAVTEHTQHSDKVNCYDCHLPQIVYGHLRFRRTHEISIPNPVLTAEKNVPNACNLCHSDKSVNWAIRKIGGFKKSRFPLSEIAENPQFNQPEAIRAMFAGNAFTRALTIDSVRKNKPENSGLLIPELENYPLVRYFIKAEKNFIRFEKIPARQRPFFLPGNSDIIISE